MDFLQYIDLAQFGVAAPFIAYLIWQNIKLGKIVDKWQDKYTNLLETQSQDYIKSAQTFDSVLQMLRSNS